MDDVQCLLGCVAESSVHEYGVLAAYLGMESSARLAGSNAGKTNNISYIPRVVVIAVLVTRWVVE